MNKEFIPYEEALALKELGFNEECFGMYQKNKKIWYCDKNNWITNFEVDPDVETLNLHIKKYPKNVSLINGIHFLHSCANFTAPTYQQAFRWLRDKGFAIIDRPFYDSRAIHKITYAKDIIRWSDGKVWKGFRKNSYGEAELACLRKLIEIVSKGN